LTGQIREARDALAAAQREREKFSRDLHDGTIQSLYAIQLGLGHTLEKLEAEPAHARREFAAVRRELDAVIAEIRQFITAGEGPDKAVDFCAVLNALVQRVRNGTRVRIALQCDPGASERLTGDRAVQLANIAREALSNCLRHAQPQQVDLALRSEPEAVVLEVSDDGNGFDPKAPRRSGVGLTSMAERAREMGAAMEIQSIPGKGTRVLVRVPAAPLEPPEADSPEDANGEA
jgi:signal transduction histidine kinase